jgi:hypothetical protein
VFCRLWGRRPCEGVDGFAAHEVEADEPREGLRADVASRGLARRMQDEVGDQRDIDLGADGVFIDAEEPLDLQVLLDPFEKEFDVPSLLVERGDLFGARIEIVGEKAQDLGSVRIFV